jgi:hypothetical protein
MVAGGADSAAKASGSTAIGHNVVIEESAFDAVAVSAYRTAASKSCVAREPGSLTLCADKNVAIVCSALVVNGVDVLKTTNDLNDITSDLSMTTRNLNAKTSDLEAKLLNTKGELLKDLNTNNLNAELLNTKAELLNMKTKLADLEVKTKDELADLRTKVAALTVLKTQSQTSPASAGSLVGTLLALSLTAAAVA